MQASVNLTTEMALVRVLLPKGNGGRQQVLEELGQSLAKVKGRQAGRHIETEDTVESSEHALQHRQADTERRTVKTG